MPLLLGIDVGTSGTKTLLCDDAGAVLATASAAHTVQSPRPGWSEQDPRQWWDAAATAVRAVLEKAGRTGDDVAAVGLSGQMHGSVFLASAHDHTPLRPALLWNDQRTAEQCRQITETAGGKRKLVDMVGNPALTGFQAPKVLWLRQHEPRLFKRTKLVLLPKDYLRLCMTGVVAGEVSDASGTLLLDVKKRRYHGKLLRKLDLDESLLPPLFESHEASATLSAAGAAHLGLREGTPVVGGGGDQAAGAVGNGIVGTGVVSASLGTSGVVFAHADEPTYDKHGRVHTMCSAVAGKWCVFGCMLSAAGSLQWYRDTLCPGVPFDTLMEEAASAPVGCEGLFFQPYLTGERCPYADPDARGSFIGLSTRHTRAHLTRAVIEGVTFGMADQVRIMADDMGLPIKTIRLSGGGSKSPFWRQLQADVYGKPVATTNSDEGPAYGAALLAGVGIGAWKSVPQACRKAISETTTLRPDKKRAARYRDLHAQYNRLYAALQGEYPRMAKLT
jgi:xylulokinase